MGELHPSPTSRRGNRPANPITKGLNRDLGPYKEAQEVHCKQCGFACNLGRDARNVDEFAGETIEKGFIITDHVYDVPYDGSDRTTTDLDYEITNGGFENWTAGNPDDWTETSGTVTEVTTAGYFYNDSTNFTGTSSAQFLRAGTTINLNQAIGTPSNFNSNILSFGAKVKCSTKEVIRLRVDINSVAYYSGYNRGQTRFEDIAIKRTCPATVSSLTIYILADNADGTAYVDDVKLMRSGNLTTAKVQAGCPHCGSYNYY